MALVWERQCVLGDNVSYAELRYDDVTMVIDVVRYQILDPLKRMFIRMTKAGNEILYYEIAPNTPLSAQNIQKNRRPVYEDLAFMCGYLDV